MEADDTGRGPMVRQLPDSTGALCQKETEQYLGWAVTTTSDELDVLTCQACGAVEEINNNGKGAGSSSSTMKRCQQCHSVCYCSRRCQEWDWRIGGHRESCKPVSSNPNQHQCKPTTKTATGGVGTSVNIKDLN